MTSKTGRTATPPCSRGDGGRRRGWHTPCTRDGGGGPGGAQSSRPGPPPLRRGGAHLAPILHPCVVQSALRIRDEAGAGGKHPGLVLCCPPDALRCRRTRGILAP